MTEPAETLRLTTMQLENWRNFIRVDARLQKRVFLVGPNASGKSNLLDSVRFLQDLVAVGGGLQFAVKKRGGVSAVRSLAARKQPHIGLKIEIGNDGEPSIWEYELRFTQDARKRPKVGLERVFSRGRELLVRPRGEDQSDPELLTQTHLEQVNANRSFRAIADFLGTVRYLHIVPQLVRDPDRSRNVVNDPYGGDFIEQVARAPKKTREARLRRIANALRIAVPQLAELDLWPDEKSRWHLRGRYEHWRPRGAWQTEDQFSDGTLRLMGLLWAALDGDGPLLLEEPELSLHPEVVRYIPQMFARIQGRSGRQIMVSTHSSDLLSDKGIGLDEVLLLLPQREGTSVRPAEDLEEIKALLAGGLQLAEVVIPMTRPERADQLALFGQ